MSSEDRGRKRRPDDVPPPRDADRPDAGPAAKFFLAVFQSGLQGSRIFRVYPEPGGLLFLYAGPVVAFIDVEMARRLDRAHWAVKTADLVKTGVLVGAGVAVLVLAVLLRLVLRAAARDLADAADLAALLLVFGGLAAVMVLVAVATTVRKITRRVAHLDALTPDGLREEAEADQLSFRATAASLSDVRIDPPGKSGATGVGKGGPAALLSFRHDPTGKWKLNLVTARDAKAAVRALRQFLGQDRVTVAAPLGREGPAGQS